MPLYVAYGLNILASYPLASHEFSVSKFVSNLVFDLRFASLCFVGIFGYSAMTVVETSADSTHVSVGIVYEGEQGLFWKVIRDFLPR